MSSCKACEESLVLQVEAQDGGETTVPDDLLLPCGCHFHWQCLLDESTSIVVSLKCPACDKFLPTNEPGPSSTNEFRQISSGTPILVQYTNEGGVQQDLDILPTITEEAYLESNPEARPAKAIHAMCSEGDAAGIIDLLRDASDEDMDMGELVRFQDPLADMKSGLHLAVEGGHEEAVWLMLWLSSGMDTSDFPQHVRDIAHATGLGRLSTDAGADIRALKDEQGLTAEEYARRSPNGLGHLLEAGALSV